jgi:hypothetical protein
LVAVVLCAAFSGFAGFGLSLAIAEGGAAPGVAFGALALGAAGLVGTVSLPLQRR